MFFLAIGFLALAVPSASPQGTFVNRTVEWNIDHELATGFDGVASSFVEDWTQRGAAFGDIDGDGDPDLVLCGGVLPSKVLRNDGTAFTDITTQAGIETPDFDSCACLADYDVDGDLDLFLGVVHDGGFGVVGRPSSRLYRNDGTGAFEEVTTLATTQGSGFSIFAQWADLDLDGLVDLLVSEFYTVRNLFYRNNGDGTFTEVGAEVGLDSPGSTHATCVLDADENGVLDVFVGNDWMVSNWADLPNNTGDLSVYGQTAGTWLDQSAGSGNDHKRGIMGFGVGDVNYDGHLDIYKTDVDANRLMINHLWPGSGLPWSEEEFAYGVECDQVPWPDHPTGFGKLVAWGAIFADFDFDLWLDLFVVNGMVGGCNPATQFSPRDEPNFLYTGLGPGAAFAFADSTAALGLDETIDDRCLAVADVDRDGDLDILITPGAGKVRFHENQIDPAGQGWLMVKPVTQTSARGAFGTLVRFTDSLGYPHVRQIGLDGPTASQHENFAYFGLGTETSVDLTVEFPSGITLALPGVVPNQVLAPVEPKLFEVSSYTLPIGFNPRLAGTAGDPTGSGGPANLYSVTAYAHDQAGNPLDGTAVVTIETPGLTPKSAVLHLGGNTFRRYFEAPLLPGSFRTEISFNGWTCKIRPRVHFYSPIDATGTTAQVVPDAVRANSADTFQVLVAPKDGQGISLGSDDVVDIQVAGLTPLSGPTDLGDGRYAATFPAPATPGIYTIQITHNGTLLSPRLEIEAGGPNVNSMSTVYHGPPQATISLAPWQYKLRLTPRDVAGRRLGPATSLVLEPVPNVGSEPVVVRSDLHPGGLSDGSFPFVVEKPQTDPPTLVSGGLRLFVDGVLKGTIPYSF
jgi:hypothetical protein